MTIGDFKKDVQARAGQVGVRPKEIHVRQMKRKLASCSTRGRLTFDVSLLKEGAENRTRAILHELLHLKYPNHGKMFNSLLQAYLAEAVNGGKARAK